MPKKKKVVPEDEEDQKLSKEELAEIELSRRRREAENWMDDKMRKSLLQPIRIDAGIVPQIVSSNLPTTITNIPGLAFLFGKASPKDLRGPPAAAARFAKLNRSAMKAVKRCFDNIDTFGEGKISCLEFMELLQVKDTVFSRELLQQSLFSLGNLDERPFLEFSAFVLATVLICTFSKDQIMFRVFKMFDADSSGYLDNEEMKKLAETINNMSTAADVKKKIDSVRTSKNSEVMDFDDFMKLNKIFPLLFYPAFKLQEELRKKTLGAPTWRKKVEEWDALEKERAALLEREPRSFADQLLDVTEWYQTGKKQNAKRKFKKAGLVVLAASRRKETVEDKLRRIGKAPPGGYKPPAERRKSVLTKQDKIELTLSRSMSRNSSMEPTEDD